MSAINLKSITGITSITTPSGVDNVFTVHTNDTTERFRVDQTGNLNIAGIVTVTKDLDVDGHTNLDNVSIAGVTTFASNISVGSSIAVGTGVTIETNGQGTFTGIVTASAFKLSDGSNVGGIDSDSMLNTVGGTLSGADIVIGGNSGSSGTDNTLFGWSAGRFIALGDGNSCFGITAGRNIGAGLWNTFIGGQAGRNMSSSYNTCVGYQASYMNNAQGYTVAFGYQAGYNATNSGRLTAIGYQAGKAHTGGNGNTYLGYQAGHLNTSGDRNVVIGDLTVSGSSDYNRVTVIGAGAAGGFGSNANNNTVVGYGAASSTLTGENNTIIGNGANPSGNVSNEITLGNSSVSHFRIPGIGVSFSEGGGVVTGIMTASSFKLLDGSAVGGFSPDAQHNLFAGTDAGASLNSSSNNNVLLGQDAGDSITSGYENVCIGLRAGQAITDTRRNTCIGPDAGRNFNAGDSVFIGWNAGSSAGSNGNVCIGHNSGTYAKGNDCAYGYSSGPTQSYSGNTNVCYGFAAGNGISQNATRNTIIGPGAGRNAATGQVNIEGNHNIIIGDEASLSSTTVSNECVIGALDGSSKAINHFRIPGIGVSFSEGGAVVSGIITATNIELAIPTSRRNFFINGGMYVAARGTVTGLNAGGFGGPDHIKLVNNLGTFTASQGNENESPRSQGFTYCYKLNCTSASGPSASNYVYLHHEFSGYDLQLLRYGYTNPHPITISFWAKCNKTGNFTVTFRTVAGVNRLISKVLTISDSNWNFYSVTFVGDTSVVNVTGGGAYILEIWLDGGTNYTGGTVQTTWSAKDNADRGAGSTLNIASSTSNYFYYTGLQIELGTVATPFEHQLYQWYEHECYRFFYHPNRGSDLLELHGMGHRVADTMGAVVQAYPWPRQMRATPTVSFDDNAGNSNRFAVNGSNNSTTNNVLLSLQQNDQGIMGAFQYPHGITNISENESFRLWAYNFKAEAEF